MSHPFVWLPALYRWGALAFLIAGTAVLALQLISLDKQLKEKVAGGIVAFELAWTETRATEILNAWEDLQDVVKRQTHLDFVFLVLYPLTLSLACAMLAGRSGGVLAQVGIALSWAVLAAAPLDAVENLAMLHMLGHGAGTLPARIAGGCAALKFTLVILTFVYLVVQGLVGAFTHWRAGRAPG